MTKSELEGSVLFLTNLCRESNLDRLEVQEDLDRSRAENCRLRAQIEQLKNTITEQDRLYMQGRYPSGMEDITAYNGEEAELPTKMEVSE